MKRLVYITNKINRIKNGYFIIDINRSNPFITKNIELKEMNDNIRKEYVSSDSKMIFYSKKVLTEEELHSFILNYYIKEMHIPNILAHTVVYFEPSFIYQTLKEIPIVYLYKIAINKKAFKKAVDLCRIILEVYFRNNIDFFTDNSDRLLYEILQSAVLLQNPIADIEFNSTELLYDLKKAKSKKYAYNSIRDDKRINNKVKRIIRDYNDYRNEDIYLDSEGAEHIRDTAVEVLYFANELLTYK